MPTTRINADAAILLKSRVALFEGTWLKYFKNTAFLYPMVTVGLARQKITIPLISIPVGILTVR